jgi:hypothetical protein
MVIFALLFVSLNIKFASFHTMVLRFPGDRTGGGGSAVLVIVKEWSAA